MPTVADFFKKYLAGADFKDQPDQTLTIKSVDHGPTFTDDDTGEVTQRQMSISFEEKQRPWLPSGEAADQIADALDTVEVTDWVGRQITLFFDPDVKFGGKKVGGVRVRV